MTMKDKKSLRSDFDKLKKEFDLSMSCLMQAMQAFHERLERLEKCIIIPQNQEQNVVSAQAKAEDVQ
jgi:hypothetical protein